MQTIQPAATVPQASNTALYRVEETFGGNNVLLEVDLIKLTPERATELCNFWSCSGGYVESEDGNPVRAAVRLFGSWIISDMSQGGGTDFSPDYESPDGDPHPGLIWSADVHEADGWGGTDDSPFGWCGIRCVAAEVASINFYSVELKEMQHA